MLVTAKSRRSDMMRPVGSNHRHGASALDGKLSELFVGGGAATRAKLRVKILGQEHVKNDKMREVRLFTSFGDAVDSRQLSDGQWPAGPIELVVEVPSDRLARDGPPLFSIVIYDEKKDDQVSGLVRFLVCVLCVSKPGPVRMLGQLGSVAEVYQQQGTVRPTLDLEVTLEGAPDITWTRQPLVKSLPDGRAQSPFTITQLKTRWDSQNTTLAACGFSSLDPEGGNIRLPFSCAGGPNAGVCVPFGSGFVTSFRDMPVDQETLLTLVTIGSFLAQGPAALRGKQATDKFSRRCILQATATLVSSLTPYMNDTRTDHAGVGTSKVESPGKSQETWRVDCEDNTGMVCPIVQAIKATGTRSLLTVAILPLLTEGFENTEPQKSADALALTQALAQHLEGLSPFFTLIDHWNKRPSIQSSTGSHSAHATVCLWGTSLPEMSFTPATGVGHATADDEFFGLMLDSVHPLTSPSPALFRTNEAESIWLSALFDRAAKDVRDTRVMVKGSPLQDIVHVLKVVSLDGTEYTPTLGRNWGCRLDDMASASMVPFSPAFSPAEKKLHRYLADIQYPLQPVTLSASAGLKKLFVITPRQGGSRALPEMAPNARAHLTDCTAEEAMNLQSLIQNAVDLKWNNTRAYTTVLATAVLLPGICPPGVVIMSWVTSS